MSLLEKAIRGTVVNAAPHPTSLFSKALAAREPEPEITEASEIAEPISSDLEPEAISTFDESGLEALARRLAELPPCHDSILEAWALVRENMPLAALALFLPEGAFLSLAAQSGFPSGGTERIPLSISSTASGETSSIDPDARAQIAPILGIQPSLILRAVAQRPSQSGAGLWVFHDPALEAASAELQSRVATILSHAADSLPDVTLSPSADDPVRVLLDSACKYPFAFAFAFDLSSSFIDESRYAGLARATARSSFLSACRRILAQGGAALAFGKDSVGCILGSTPSGDPDLAYFQFTKTLKRILPRFAASSFPPGRSRGFGPSSESALEELSGFLSE
jgi:hypothetical protein